MGEETYRELAETDVSPEVDEGRRSELYGPTSVEHRDLSITGADVEETSKFISNATKYYLQDNLDDMELLNNLSSQTMMKEAKDKIIGKEISPAEKKKYLKRYAIGEKLNSYFKAVSTQ